MFDIINPEITVTVSGGTTLENKQMCAAMQIAMRLVGFRSVDCEGNNTFACGNMNDANLLNYIRSINPDLFDTEIAVRGETQEDIERDLRQLTMGISDSVNIFNTSRSAY